MPEYTDMLFILGAVMPIKNVLHLPFNCSVC